MRRYHRFAGRAIVGTALAAMSFGCANHTQRGAALGAAGGAGLGAVIGHQFGATGAGALIGSVAGTAGGALAGNMQDERQRRDYYARQAAYERHDSRRRQWAVTNRDVIDMAAYNTSDRVIISTIEDRGGNFDMSPYSIIALQRSGVSDRVIEAMQHHNMNR